MSTTLVVALLLSGLLACAVAECPPEISTRPCTCYTFNEQNTLKCENLKDQNDLKGIFQKTNGTDYNTLFLSDSDIESFPSDGLVRHKIQDLRITDVNLKTLFDKLPPSFTVLSFFRLERVNFSVPFPWSQLQTLTKLTTLELFNVAIPALDNTFKERVNEAMSTLELYRNGLEHMDEEVIPGFLKQLSIVGNPKLKIKRNNFPRPCNLEKIDLGANEIETLPGDIFEDMPELRFLDLSGNPMTTISEEVFSPIIGQLEEFRLVFNPINCDCGLYWIIYKEPRVFDGECETPKELEGRPIRYLHGMLDHCQ